MNNSTNDFIGFEKIPTEWRVALVISIVSHFIFFITIIFFTGINYNSKRMPGVIDVDLTWTSPPPVVKKTEKVKKKAAVVKKKSRRKIKKKVKKKKIALKSKNKKKKKKVAKSKDIINDAIKRLKKDLDKTEPDTLAERMKQLEDEVKTTDEPRVDDRPSGQTGGANSLSTRYSSYVKEVVRENWAFSENLAAGGKNLLTTISFIVMPNGEIRGVKVEKKSGNSYMDSAASMAVVKSNSKP